MSLPSDQWGSGPAGKKSDTYIIRCINSGGYQGLEWMEELTGNVVSSLKECLRWKEGKQSGGPEEPGLADVQPSRSKTLRRERRCTSTERDLFEAREPIREP